MKGSRQGAIAILLQNSSGNLIDGVAKSVVISSVLQGEALAIRMACHMAKALNLSNIEIEGDNKQVILLCVSETVPPWECNAILHDTR
ncbi:hypothetical protein ACSBR1_006171 [Camellia fascicularis]